MNDLAPSGSRAYEPGDWFAVIGPRVIVVLPPEEKPRVAGLWALVDDGAGFDETLDALIADGLRALSGFLLVTTEDGVTTVVVRGAARATFVADGESVELDGSGATTWVEQTLSNVESVVVDVSDAPGTGASYSIDQGLVRISRLTEGVVSAPVEAELPGLLDGPVHAEADSDPTPGDGYDDALDDGSDLQFESEPEEAPLALVGQRAVEESFDPVRPIPIDPLDPLDPLAFTSVALVPDLPADEVEEDEEDEEAEVEVDDDAPTETFAATPDHDGRTQLSPFDEEFALVRPGIPGQTPAPPVTSRPVARLLLSTGANIDVDRVVIFGRAPVAPRSLDSEDPVLVEVPSPNQEISSTHVEIRPGSGADHGTAVVTDLGSTNGTIVMQPGLEPEELQPGVSVQLIPGALIDLGDGITIQVTRP